MTTWHVMTFRDELDLLEIKLATLNSVTDRWVISESAVTHAGQPKEIVYGNNQERFAPWADKVTYAIQEQPPEGEWAREHGQRQMLSGYLADAEDDDLVMVSDLDEVPDPAYWGALELRARNGEVATPRLTMHVLGLRWRWTETWPGGARLVTMKTLREQYGGDVDVLFGTYNDDVAALWANDGSRLYGPARPPGAGWHFSHLGGVEGVLTKLAASVHTEFNIAPYNDPEHIARCIETGDDLLMRADRKQEPADKRDLPLYVQAHWDRFRHLW